MSTELQEVTGAITIIWNNGSVTTGDNWTELERNIRANQWHSYESKREFRDDMRHRAWVWSGKKLSRSNSPEEFIRSLADCGMFMIAPQTDGDTIL